MPTTTEDATCLACGCLCDDIRVVVEAGKVIEADRACSTIGKPWFLEIRPEGRPPATIDGQAVPIEAAIDRAVEILSRSKSPLVWGMRDSSIEAQGEALAIADQIGAVVDSGRPDPILAAFQRIGQVSATLGEVKDRADLVVFWGVDPVTTHPRHFERYSVDPPGRFLPEGRSVIVVDHKETPTALASDHCVHVPPDRQGEALRALRGLVRGIAVDPDRLEASAGVPLEALEDLADRMKKARYGAFFFGDSLGESWVVEAALLLVRDLNVGRRFVAMTLGSGGNSDGLGSVMTWQAGAPSSVDFGTGIPRYLPGDATLKDRHDRGEVDAVLALGEVEVDAIPTILIGPGATARRSAVAFDVARLGIEAGGTVGRVDGVMLPLNPAIDSGLPSDRDILKAIRSRLWH